MAGDRSKKDEGNGLNRRSFLETVGAVFAGGALAAGLPLATETAAAAETPAAAQTPEPTTITNFRCPLCAKDFATFAALKVHFAAAHPGDVVPVVTKLKVNGTDYEVLIEPNWTLQRTLQQKLGLTGAKQMCDRGVCGSCTVIIDGRAVLSCTTLSVECEGKSIETVEGIAANAKWNPLIHSYTKWDAMQCGYCTPGFVVSAKNLLDHNSSPSETTASTPWPAISAAAGRIPDIPPRSWSGTVTEAEA